MRVLVFGTFDDLHPGHHYLLTKAMGRGELFVSVSRDSNVLRIKGRLPLQTQEERAQAIRDAFPQATVSIGHETDFLEPVRRIQPDLILLGYDQHMPPGLTEDMLGCPVERVDAFEPHVHKSSIRRAQREANKQET